MATQFLVDDGAVETPVSIYFGLERGDRADLEIVAEAAIAWSSAFKTIVAAVEPGLTVKVQLVDGDDGSLWLNTLLSFIESKLEQMARGADRYPRLKALARGLAIIVVATPLSVTSSQVWEAIVADDPEIGKLSPEAENQVRGIFEKVIDEKIAEAQRERFAKAVAKDPRITSVGVAPKPDGPPRLSVTREQNIEFINREKIREEEEGIRKRTVTMDVILVSPVLEDAERSWKFRQPGLPEFGAIMRDHGFLSAMARHAIHEELRFGILMKIEMEFKERLDGEVWVPVERSVVSVIEPTVDRGELPF